jgi:quercetin dioxygenase-like cupin family protein
MDKILKNIEFEKALELCSLVDYHDGQVVSRTLVQNKHVSITLFSFDKGEEISAHSSSGDALVTVLEGEAEITIGDNKRVLKGGQSIVMPAQIPHALFAKERFKMLLVVVFPG